MDDFIFYYVSGIGVKQIGGKVVVFQNGIVVFVVLFYEIGFIVFLMVYYLVIVFLDVCVFGVQVCLVFWFFKDDLIVIIMYIIQCIDGVYRFWLIFCLFLMKLYFICLQVVIFLYNVYVVGKNGIVWVVIFSVIGIDSNWQIVGIVFYQRMIVVWYV